MKSMMKKTPFIASVFLLTSGLVLWVMENANCLYLEETATSQENFSLTLSGFLLLLGGAGLVFSFFRAYQNKNDS